jgi:DNA segregation ATPase FtsK/SpoIIIE, S-DNA-T family
MSDISRPVSGWRSLDGDPKSAFPGDSTTGWREAGTATRTARPVFQRVPRSYLNPPEDKVEIQPPPQRPSEPSTSMITILLPVIGTVIMIGVMLVAFTGRNIIFMLAYMPVMLLSYVAAFINHTASKRKYREQTALRDSQYLNYLRSLHQVLVGLVERQRQASLVASPSPMECLALVERTGQRLWERSPRDADFLHLRLGIGSAPASFSIDTGSLSQDMLKPDPLISEAQKMAQGFANVPNIAVDLPLTEVGAAGIAGSQHLIQQTLRSLITQLASLHAPTEVKLVMLFPESDMEDWAWVRWLPHTWSDDRSQRFVAASTDDASRAVSHLSQLVRQRAIAAEDEQRGSNGSSLPVYVLVCANTALTKQGEASAIGVGMQTILSQGPAVGVYALVAGDRSETLPRECGAIVRTSPSENSLRIVGPPASQTQFFPDSMSVANAETMGRRLAPLRMAQADAATSLPEVVTLLDMLGVSYVEELPALDSWKQEQPFRSLSVPIGVRAGGDLLTFDVHERGHGPHGLVAGATGSGKSELLQSIIASLSIKYHPHEVAFILIDYKGGGMANVFRNLPHQIGIITNLGGNLAARALAALRSEYERRQRLFDEVGVTHIDEYQKLHRQGQADPALPHLIIIADEFAELVQNQPEFMAELVSGVRVGRSLGVHLVLATQKPAGVVNDQIWGNTRFRLCLRVERPEDSKEVLKRDDAASIRRPGRAYFQVGMDEVFELFQTAWSGAQYNPSAQRATGGDTVAEVQLNGARRRLWPSVEGARPAQSGQTQLQAVVEGLHQVAESSGIIPLKGPWLPPLAETIFLPDARPLDGGWDGQAWKPSSGWLAPVIGIVDNPREQSQTPLRLDFGREGHLAIYGSPGSGKSTLLQTLVTSLAQDHTPAEVNLYLVDFGGRQLSQFNVLPHVGSVVFPDDSERLHRLFGMVFREMESRKRLLSQAGASTFAAYRRQNSDSPPGIVIVIDNFAEFRSAYENLVEDLEKIIREGSNLGIHAALTCNSAAEIPLRLQSNVGMVVALELQDSTEYALTVGRSQGLYPASGVPGRGLVRAQPPLEFQTALPSAGEDEMVRSLALKELISQMDAAWDGRGAEPVPELPQQIALSQVLLPSPRAPEPRDSLAVPIGLEVETLQPFAVDLDDGPSFLITGSVGGGKTTLLQTWVLALAESFSANQVQLYVVGIGNQRLSIFQTLPHVRRYVRDDEQFTEVLGEIEQVMDERSAALEAAREAAGGVIDEQAFVMQYPPVVLVGDDLDQWEQAVSEANQRQLQKLMGKGRGLRFYVILAGAIEPISRSYSGLAKALRDGMTGFLVGTAFRRDLDLFTLSLPHGEADKPLPPGHGFFARRSRYQRVLIADCKGGQPDMPTWLDSIRQRNGAAVP